MGANKLAKRVNDKLGRKWNLSESERPENKWRDQLEPIEDGEKPPSNSREGECLESKPHSQLNPRRTKEYSSIT